MAALRNARIEGTGAQAAAASRDMPWSERTLVTADDDRLLRYRFTYGAVAGLLVSENAQHARLPLSSNVTIT